MKFKTDREQKEWDTLKTENPALHRFGELLDAFVILELNKNMTVTSVFRTKEEQDALYAQVDPAHKVLDSPHMHWHAFDLRSSVFDDNEIHRILAFANTFRYVQGLPVALYHKISGNVFHFHFQYKGHDFA